MEPQGSRPSPPPLPCPPPLPSRAVSRTITLQEGETVIHGLRPEPEVAVIWFFTRGLPATFAAALISFFCIVLLGGACAALADPVSSPPVAAGAVVAIIAAFVAVVLALAYYRALRDTYVYTITNQRCVFQGGIWVRVARSISHDKITDVEVTQHIVERWLGISSLSIYTPGTGGVAAEITFVGLKDSETPAATVNDILRKLKATGSEIS